ncbi:MAG: carbonic anhydrase, partial [Nitrospirota bacterium]
MKKINLIYAILISIVFATSAFAASNPLERLLDGNKRFVAGTPARKETGEKIRRQLAKGQHPFAIVLACSDSR